LAEVVLKATIHSTGIFIVQPNSFGNEIAPDPILLWVPNMRYLRFTDCVNTPRLAA
jgi:hypothetical protein